MRHFLLTRNRRAGSKGSQSRVFGVFRHFLKKLKKKIPVTTGRNFKPEFMLIFVINFIIKLPRKRLKKILCAKMIKSKPKKVVKLKTKNLNFWKAFLYRSKIVAYKKLIIKHLT